MISIFHGWKNNSFFTTSRTVYIKLAVILTFATLPKFLFSLDRNLVVNFPNHNLNSAAILKSTDNIPLGTGFVFLSKKSNGYLITANHVITVSTLSMKGYLTGGYSSYTVTIDTNIAISYRDAKLDYFVVKLGELQNKKLEPSFGVKFIEVTSSRSVVYITEDFTRTYDNVDIGNDAVILGFPAELPNFDQFDFEKPLLRRAMIAGKNTKKQTIVMDGGVFGGNSGGPVFEIRRFSNLDTEYRLIGISLQFIPYFSRMDAQGQLVLDNIRFLNSNYSIVLPIEVIINRINIEESKRLP